MISSIKFFIPNFIICRLRKYYNSIYFSSILEFIRYSRVFFADSRKYFINTFSSSKSSKTYLYTIIARKIHVIEKGLAMKTVKSDFGVNTVFSLMENLEKYLFKFEVDYVVNEGFNILNNYLINSQLMNYSNKELQTTIIKFFNKFKAIHDNIDFSEAILNLHKSELLLSTGKVDFNNFANLRYSVRNFSEEQVSQIVVQDAIRIAMKSPSSCNVQPWKVHIYHGKQKVVELLRLQNGNRGFNSLIKSVLVISVDMRLYSGIAERNLSYIDGGIFLMSLVYSLQYKGVGSVILNLALPRDVEERFRKVSKINEFEVLISMVAIGNYPESLKVPRSKRKPINDVVYIH